MHFNLFVLPFLVGVVSLTALLSLRYVKWLGALKSGDLQKIGSNIFTLNTLFAIKEVFMESLLHRKIFKINKSLGFMHMSLAFGWFLLIIVGKFETLYYTGKHANEIYYPIFFRFFEQTPHRSTTLQIFNATMDFLLLMILSGLAIAIIRRFRPRITGTKKTTKHSTGDRLALTSLWFIFPMRLLAESATAGFTGNGSFLTQPLGNMMALFLPVEPLSMVFWWMYSFSLGLFMIAIPFSRYMHIPTEICI